ncbi:MAG: esterase family protein, partial [Sphingobacteriales bacterium]
ALPVVYLLHGLLGNYQQFIDKLPGFTDYADKYNVLLVCPDGQPAGWYFDSPEAPQFKYETYISTEVVAYVDSHYKTIKNRKGRAIIGASMGGHGAFYIAFKHQDIFGAAGSICGAVDIRPYPKMFAIQNRLGDYAKYPERWEQNTVINLMHLLTPNSLALVIDCGTEDMFFGINNALHQKLLDNNIPHVYTARPGSHTFAYMADALHYQMLFMANFFQK